MRYRFLALVVCLTACSDPSAPNNGDAVGEETREGTDAQHVDTTEDDNVSVEPDSNGFADLEEMIEDLSDPTDADVLGNSPDFSERVDSGSQTSDATGDLSWGASDENQADALSDLAGMDGTPSDVPPIGDAAALDVAIDLSAYSPPETPCGAPSEDTLAYDTYENTVTDESRSRQISYMVYYAPAHTGCTAIVLVSHGGNGSTTGHRKLGHLGSHYAETGYLAIHIGHRSSETDYQHRSDRPADVSFILDQLESGDLPLPNDFQGELDFDRIGHVGHSWGAYTAHAVGGGHFDQGEFTDPRIRAIVPISPQGPDRFGSFDRGAQDNTWMDVTVPAFNLVGEEEKDAFRLEDSRLRPFLRYPVYADKFLSVLPGQGHNEMGGGGEEGVQRHIARNSRLFLDV
ncbi:MAG: hypothetical protein KC561_06620, partial [Myxococcales bacterium]|nr:hypothetical protein [Myxococcales bacterium]